MNKINPEILFICSTAGLGHVTRDLAIAKELRKIIPKVKIFWVAAPPVSDYLQVNNEKLLPESSIWPSETLILENTSDGVNLNLAQYAANANETWKRQLSIFQDILGKRTFDLIIGDETYGIARPLFFSILKNDPQTQIPFVIIYDFIGLRPMTDDEGENELVRVANDRWLSVISGKIPPGLPKNLFSRLFVGEIDDVKPRVTSKGVVDFREIARESVTFLGNIVRFNPEDYTDKEQIKARLGYSSSPLIVCSIGGSNVGTTLLELCVEAFRILAEKVPEARMVLVCGPRVNPGGFDLPSGVAAFGYVPNLIDYYAACDLAIIQPGLSSTMELVALRKPFIYFPIPQHSEQEEIAEKLERRGIGTRMSITGVTPLLLAESIKRSLCTNVNYSMKDFNGAQNAANYIQKLISS